MKKPPSKVAQKLLIIGPDLFFSTANQPKSSTNFNSFSIKNLPSHDFGFHIVSTAGMKMNFLKPQLDRNKNAPEEIVSTHCG